MTPTSIDNSAAFVISILALWICPIGAWVTIHLSRGRLRLRRNVLTVCGSLTFLTLVSTFLRLSTTSLVINWLLLANAYFTFCLLTWWSIYTKKWFAAIPGALLGFGTILLGYVLSTIGAIGLGFIVSGETANEEAFLQERYNYRQIPLGNAVADHRGATVVLSRKLPLLPIEYVVLERTYVDNFSLYLPLRREVNIDIPNRVLLICAEPDSIRHLVPWADTLHF